MAPILPAAACQHNRIRSRLHACGRDVVVVGAGLAGLVAAAELADAGRRVIMLDQEPEASLGGQAHWSFGGLFLVNSPEQRRLRVHDSHELALQDWMGSAGFDRDEDFWPRQWAEAYVDFAAGEKRAWLHEQGLRLFPLVQWAERGGYFPGGHGNSVPRFHVTWGTGPGRRRAVPAPGARGSGARAGRAAVPASGDRAEPDRRGRRRGRRRGARAERRGARGGQLAASSSATSRCAPRPSSSPRAASAPTTTWSGAAGRPGWAQPPAELLSGVPAHVDGLMIGVAEGAGARVINPDRMWHYPEGIVNHSPVWDRHGIRILSGPSPLWLDATGRRLPPPLYPGFDALGALEHVTRSGHGHSWFLLNKRIIGKEFALSGSEQNPDLTGRDVRQVLSRARVDVPGPVQAFLDRGVDFVERADIREPGARP